MDSETIVRLLGVLVWPATLLTILYLFRRQIVGMTELVQRVEGPGGVKIFLDRKRVEEIIKEGAKENTPAGQIADRIVKAAEVKDFTELRILRALFDEDDGRLIVNYAKNYTQAMKNLSEKGYIEKRDRKYFLTGAGLKATRQYLQSVLARQDVTQH